MTFEFTKVESSNIAEIAYHVEDTLSDTGTLAVRFKSGQEYRYEKFPTEMAEEFVASESVGKYFHSKIRPGFNGVKVEEVPEEPTETRYSRQRDAETEATGKLESEGEEF